MNRGNDQYVQQQGDRPGQWACPPRSDPDVLGVVVDPVHQGPEPGRKGPEVPSEQAVDALEQNLVDPDDGPAEHVERGPGGWLVLSATMSGIPAINQGLDVNPLHEANVDIGRLEEGAVDIDPTDETLDIDAVERN